MDDDFGFHPTNLRRFLARLESDWRERMVVSVEQTKQQAPRFGNDPKTDKWAFSKHEMPWPRLAPYCFGNFYFLGYELVEKLAIAMHFTRPIPIDDVWLGLVMTKLGLRFQYRRGIRLVPGATGTSKRDIIMPMTVYEYCMHRIPFIEEEFALRNLCCFSEKSGYCSKKGISSRSSIWLTSFYDIEVKLNGV
ncbi:unnamed protein product [Dibothriocephalus latus]|uniref:Hexosyltransferase n=1 Tax=Dibothriocephalus latus TaxID=60516 RepID=A0A3P7NT60_DIBLA|nr:unnamed protein product [Dibothriocephalus latus]